MDFTAIIQVINAVGFPIFCVVCLGYYIKDQNKNQMEYIKEINKSHEEEVRALTENLTKIVISVQSLADKIDELVRRSVDED